MKLLLASWIGRAVARLTRWLGGHGSALPGLIVETLVPDFLPVVLGTLPRGVMVVSGTNGKTTTTKMVVELLRAAGLKVFTNPSGSNFTRGVVSSAALKLRRGRLDADVAVLELDEAYAVRFVRLVPPRQSLLLNVLRDQLDRFGEIDATARLLAQVAQATTGQAVLNANDPRLAAVADDLTAAVGWFGFAEPLRPCFPTDEELHAADGAAARGEAAGSDEVVRAAGAAAEPDGRDRDVIRLERLDGPVATYSMAGRSYPVALRLFGPHNALNGAAALAGARSVLGPAFAADAMVARLGVIEPAFGRGEVFRVDGRDVRLILVKNPSGFRLSLGAVAPQPTLIAINDAYADGRDVSWLWDVDCGALRPAPMVVASGQRAYDMALRLRYDGVSVAAVEPEPDVALRRFLAATGGRDAQILATYTAMLALRGALKKEAP